MPKDDPLYVGHMLETARKAHQKVSTIGRDDFVWDTAQNDLSSLIALLQDVVPEDQR